ncbi:hypothetical protein BCR35DRAFT_306977 [Leucosporidium creatinivorum]|uniref:SUR7/PalI family-domain-containing protein n=1 Tax=Leucosporidium creatinivorum TaxID=106004 RepID=A0A1Y2EQJ1_9BASI|nr:hypothetical protein BCR35DRAFT_306977 [Leucosporidium creatinivorum]
MKILLPLYTVALAVAITSFGLSLASLLSTDWIHFETPTSSPVSLRSTYGLFQRCDSSSWTGDSVTCRKFPTRSQDCGGSSTGRATTRVWERIFKGEQLSEMEVRVGMAGGEAVGGDDGWVGETEKRRRLGKGEDDEVWSFCDSWVTAGYAQQLAIVFAAAAILAALVVLLGGRLKRESGWRIIAGLLSVHAACLIVSTSLIVHEFRTDDRFYFGSTLDRGYIESTVAWALDVVIVGALVLVGVVGFTREDDYERIPE